MFRVGGIRKANEIGYKGVHYYIWVPCKDCKMARWVQLVSGKPQNKRCRPCSNKVKARKRELAPQWKGGKIKTPDGYINVSLLPNDFFYQMADSLGYVKEHRLAMAQHLGRNLHSWELVHHKNHIRDDNRIENLQLVGVDQHDQMTKMESKLDSLLTKQDELMTEIRLLRLQNKILMESQKR